jgi:arylsulfatase
VLQVIPDPVPAGADLGGVRPGEVLLNVNGKQQEAHFANVLGTMGWETLDVGSDLGSAVSSEYTSPNRFTGTIQSVQVELK